MPVVASIAGPVLGAVVSRVATSGARKRAKRAARAQAAQAKKLSATGDQMLSIMQDRWKFYKQHGERVDVTLIQDAMNFFKETFEGGAEEAASRAAEDVASAFDRAADIRGRRLQRFGVDPTSGRFEGLERGTEVERARAEAGARNRARRIEEDRARANLRSVAPIGRSAVGQAGQFGAIAGDLFSAASGVQGSVGRAAERSATGTAALIGDVASRIPFGDIFPSGGGGGANGGVVVPPEEPGGTFNPVPLPEPNIAEGGLVRSGLAGGGRVRRTSYQGGGAVPDGRGGGKLSGPGTGTSDSIPAVVDGRRPVRLSDGEFIIPARVVRQKGTEFFNKLIAQPG